MRQLRRSIGVIFIILLALPLAVFGQAQWAEGGTIELGQTISGQLSADDQAVGYTFVAEAGTTVTITLRSNDFDAYLSLRDENGLEIAFDDDSAGNLNSRIGPFIFEMAGSYTIVATSYGYRFGDSGGTGRFELSVAEAQLQIIEYGKTVEGELTPDEPQMVYSFTGAEGDAVVITMVPLDFDPFDAYANLVGTDGFEIGFAYVNMESGNVRMGPLVLPQTGTYTIRAGTFSQFFNQPVGRFTLSVEQVEIQTIAFDETVEVTFDGSAAAAYFIFEAAFGDTLNLVVDGNLDTNVAVLDSFSYQIVFDEDSGPGFNPRIDNLVINSTDTYTVVLSLTQPGSTGTAALTVMQAQVPLLGEAPVTLTFTEPVFRQVVRYESDGSPVRLTVTSLSGPFSPNLEIPYGDETFSGAYFSGSDVQEISAVFTPPPGTITIIINNNSWSEVTVEVTVTRLGR
jgi:hypothetical protein